MDSIKATSSANPLSTAGIYARLCSTNFLRKAADILSYYLDNTAADRLLHSLQKEYRIFAPKRFPKEGRFSDTDIIRYAEFGREITSLAECELRERSTYSAKEVV